MSHWDGHPQWWFNLRASNTEPLLRLNVEAADEDIMEKVRDDVLALVRQDGEGDDRSDVGAVAGAVGPRAAALPGDGCDARRRGRVRTASRRCVSTDPDNPLAYPVRDGIPVLLVDEGVPGPPGLTNSPNDGVTPLTRG